MKSKIIYAVALSSMLLSSCTDWMDINHSPNDALQSTVTNDLLLSSVQNTINHYRIAESSNLFFMAQHCTKSGDVSGTYTFLTGLVMPQNFDDFWNHRYSNLANIKVIEDKAIENGDAGYEGIAKTLKTIEYRELVDMFGNVPYTEAALGAEALAPKYDKGADIYADLLKQMDRALECFDEVLGNAGYTSGALKTADIMFNADFAAWKRYAASIKLSLLMRISNVQDVSSQVKALVDEVMDINENATSNPGYYKSQATVSGSTYSKMNPLYATWGYNYLDKETSNHKYITPTEELMKFMRETNNPLIRVYADPRAILENDEDGKANYDLFGLENERYVGNPYGMMAPAGGKFASKVGLGVLAKSSSKVDGPLEPVLVMQGSLTGFYLAEAALRGMIDGGDAAAKSYYEEAVTSLFNTYERALQDEALSTDPEKSRPAITGTAAQAAAEFLSQDNAAVNWDLMTTFEEKMHAIQAQKWLSLYMVDPLEAWAEIRRTDMPNFLHASNSIAEGSKIIARFLYPNGEKTLNPENYVDGIDIYNDLVFWDQKNEDVDRAPTYE